MEERKASKPLRYGIIAASVVAIIVLLLMGDIEKVKNVIASAGVFGLFIAIIAYGILGVTFIPTEPITVLIAGLFGPWIAIIVSTIGNLVAGFGEYYVGSKLGDAAQFLSKKEKLPFGLGKFPVNSPYFLIGGRMIPGYGPKIVSFLSGMYHLPLGLVLWTMAIPTFLGAVIFALGGTGLFNLVRGD